MPRNALKRWGGAPVAAAAAALLLGAASAGADVTVERAMNTGGLGGFGASDMTTVEKISGLRKRSVTSVKMTGFLGKMAGDLGGDEITDLPKDALWRLDHKKKTYTESKITPPPEPPAEKQQGKAEKSKVRVVRSEVTVKETGEKKTIGAYPCAHFVVTWVVETEDLETKERSESTMTTDLWTTAETDEIRALTKEEREFTLAWLKKIGWDISEQEARKMGMGMIGSLLGGDEASFKKGAMEVAEKMERVKGFPIGTGVTWKVKGGAGAKKGGDESAGMPDMSKGLGGLMAAMGKKSAKAGGGAAAGGDGATTVFDTYVEIRKISTAALPETDFVPPAGYKKVSP